MKPDENAAAAVQQFLDANFCDNVRLKPRSSQSITSPLSRLSQQLQIILEREVPDLCSSMSVSAKFVKRIHSLRAKVTSTITSVEEALMVDKN
jgi:NAD(P)H-dependent flavin oxidoreductase YrpB (nitropropane dioxygenase family)